MFVNTEHKGSKKVHIVPKEPPPPKIDVFVKHRCPRRQPSQNMKSYILIPPHPQGHVMSVKCEELI